MLADKRVSYLGGRFQELSSHLSRFEILFAMRVISNKALTDFSVAHPEASVSLQTWRKVIELSVFTSFASLKNTFNTVDKVGLFYVFDIGGNKYRVVAAIHFDHQKLYIRHVFTHKEYDKWKP